jgi:hypothetical protein
VTVRLDAPVLAEYQAFAAEHGLTVADLMRYGASVLIQGERARQALLAGEL